MQGEKIRLHVLKSVLAELTAAGSKAAAALEFAKTFCEVVDDTMFDGETPCQKLKAMLGKSLFMSEIIRIDRNSQNPISHRLAVS